ncbi:hypothetical protein [Pseudoduganella namucuonensis]|uniref:hypothetical protein n=1 Tax=Pseudoduganella namucuonensis TaxID=1035707 RepID=UPI001160A7F1|nr:hypothetical protein [Pseudoduganella namucuonensis]
MIYRFNLLLVVIAFAGATSTAFAQDPVAFAIGTYRIEGACVRTFHLGADAMPECDRYLGIKVDDASKPMFIFPLRKGGEAWFFVTSVKVNSNKERAVYSVEKLYDQTLNAEFPYPAGECEIISGPTVRCTVWKDGGRTVIARELIFSGLGTWQHQK